MILRISYLLLNTVKYSLTDSDIMTTVGQRLKAERLQQNLSAEELARRAGLSRLTVAKAEAGRR